MLITHPQSKQAHFHSKLEREPKSIAIPRPVTRNVSVGLDSAGRILRVPFSVIVLKIGPHNIILATQKPS
jgi:hypothetical protein